MNILRLIPKKPINQTGYKINKDMDTSDGLCPKCCNNIVNITPRSRRITYCSNCGQAIKWY